MLKKIIYISILFLLPPTANAMCFFEENPVNLTVKISSCDEVGMHGKILSGLEEGDSNKDVELLFRISSKSEDKCQMYKEGETVKINVLRECCDTPEDQCFFGRVLTAGE